jgi:hypothetical protein
MRQEEKRKGKKNNKGIHKYIKREILFVDINDTFDTIAFRQVVTSVFYQMFTVISKCYCFVYRTSLEKMIYLINK